MAKALILRPKYMILEEPGTGLSPANERTLFHILRQIKENEKITILLIEQNISIALAFCSNAVIIKNGLIEIITKIERGYKFE